LVLAAIAALVMAVLPVLAVHGPEIPPESSFHHVTPTEVSLGGEGGDCEAVDADGEFELRIENPQDGASIQANHGAFTVTFTILDVYKVGPNEFFDWTIDAAGTDLIVKGGSESAHYDYADEDHGIGGSVQGDDKVHATEKKGSRLHSVSHATVCYDVVATISGKVWHDHDQDGTQDNGVPATSEADEPDLVGWTVRAYDSSGTEVASTDTNVPAGTDADGEYSFPGLPIGEEYTICEEAPSGQWYQSNLPGPPAPSECPAGVGADLHPGEEPQGHFIDLQGDEPNADFGNFNTVNVVCDGRTIGEGEHAITLPSNADLCTKAQGEYVYETYEWADRTEVHDFGPIGGGGGFIYVTEIHTWSINNEQGSTLSYNDDNLLGDREALYCNFVPDNVPFVDLDDVTGLFPGNHTTCIIASTEDADGDRVDTLASRIDGRRWV
jgi:hypothetical protein